MKGIILAGGKGTRLYPMTKSVSKQLLPIYDKPLIYYPLSILLLASIKEILIISTPHDIGLYQELLGDGSKIGVKFSYVVQNEPKGLGEAFILGKEFIGNDSVCLILGDNVFYGSDMTQTLIEAIENNEGATIFGYPVKDPSSFGVVEFDQKMNVISLEEKPKKPKSNYCVTGLYFYPKDVVKMAKKVKKSKRGEYEITALNNLYIQAGRMHLTLLGRGYSWLDTGTPEALNDACDYVKMIEEHQGIKMMCPEEIAYINRWIDKKTLIKIANSMNKNDYGEHLMNVAKGKILYASSIVNEK